MDDLVDNCSYDDLGKKLKSYVDDEDTDLFNDAIFDNLKNNLGEEDDLIDNLFIFDHLGDNLKMILVEKMILLTICFHLMILVKISKTILVKILMMILDIISKKMDEEDAIGDNLKNNFGGQDDLVENCSYDDLGKNLKKYVDEEDTDFFNDAIFDKLKSNFGEEDDLIDNLFRFDDISENLKNDFGEDFNDVIGYNLKK
jgi:dihydroneopterin aldolase